MNYAKDVIDYASKRGNSTSFRSELNTHKAILRYSGEIHHVFKSYATYCGINKYRYDK